MISLHFSQLWAQAESHLSLTRKYWSYYRYDKSKFMFYLFIFVKKKEHDVHYMCKDVLFLNIKKNIYEWY